MEIMKKCSGCGRLLPLSEFNKLRRSKDGHQPRCRQCFSEYNKKRYALNPDKYKEDVRRYREENPESELETRIKACEKDPSHKNAYRAVDAALRCGVLIRPDVCSGCGCPSSEHRIEAHHHDYAKPLDVIWLCTPCHEKMDAEHRLREGKRNHSLSRPVVMKQDGKVVCHFPSMADAARAVQRSTNSIRQALNGKSKLCAGFEWAYDEDSDDE